MTFCSFSLSPFIASESIRLSSWRSTTCSGCSNLGLLPASTLTSLPCSRYSSRETRLAICVWLIRPSSSAPDMPSSFDSSSFVALRPFFASNSCIAWSSFFCFWRSVLGIQSIFLIWSRIDPLIRRLAYVSNLTPLVSSNLSIASISPKMPYPTKSSYSTV